MRIRHGKKKVFNTGAGLEALLCLLVLSAALPPRGWAAQVLVVVRDAHTLEPLPGSEIALGPFAALADSTGAGAFAPGAGRYVVRVRRLGYEPAERAVAVAEKPQTVRVLLRPAPLELSPTVTAAPRLPDAPGRIELSVAEIRAAPAPTPDPVRFVKVLPGVSSGNDFSSGYNAAGGNYTENLVYINGVEIETPLQIRRGLAETFSLVNPDLVGRIRFQSVAFPVRYGDKLSSVLDVDYRRPQSRLGGRAEVSTLQQRLAAEGRIAPSLRWIAGGRRADLGRLARGLQTSGRFRPFFADGQGVLEWDRGEAGAVSLYGAVLGSRFSLDPASQVLRYNCDGRSYPVCEEFHSAARGRERFDYDLRVLGLRWARRAAGRAWRLYAHALQQREREDTDVAYRVVWKPRDEGRGQPGDDLRLSELYASRLSLLRAEAGWAGEWDGGAVGGGLRWVDIDGRAAGAEEVEYAAGRFPLDRLRQRVERRSWDAFAYGQRHWRGERSAAVGGARLLRVGATGELLLLPRFRVEYAPGPVWSAAATLGRYAQPPLYREFAGAGRPRSQKAVQATAGLRWAPAASWHARAEAYYRHLTDLNPYSLDDLRVAYAGTAARGFAYGANAYLRGELSRMVGIASYGYLVAREDLRGDGAGFVPRPTDQRHTFSAYLEDRMRLRPHRFLRGSALHVRVLYGSGFPHTPKLRAEDGPLLVDGARHSRRDRGYWRFDIGMTQTLEVAGRAVRVREEVANVFDQFNVVGHTYLPTPAGKPVELRNALGRRVYNLSVAVDFGRAGRR